MPTEESRSNATAEARAAFTASLTSVGTNLDADLRTRAGTLHDNAAVIEKQQEDLKRTTQEVSKQSKELEKLLDQGQTGLKEVGDLQNFAEVMERDLLVLEETLRLAEEEDQREGRVEKPAQGWLKKWF
ncbi:uncharacterized protein GIQ15_02137 [Arthroderma uncinatum]|uniref:uncharacterized protein n=1 Tax=Arthroderma uncinatum TaxID=74035 RepID=UPI00144ABA9E|nr:uncharacterized protein GIQ15_02137 [Arthroderma uncinatum]KAF3482813.1 hypothetical protein GIQ15_02137 [Arthroderma uncinatum]